MVWILVELAVVVLQVQKGLWPTGNSRLKTIEMGFSWVGITALLDTLALKLYGKKQLGLVAYNSWQTNWIADWTIVCVGCIWLICWAAGTARRASFEDFLLGQSAYLVWAFGQQFVMESYVFVRIETLVQKLHYHPYLASLATALLFSWAHRPNRGLMAITLVGGFVSSEIFRRKRNLFALALAHGFVGAALAEFGPTWFMHVGQGFEHIMSHH